MTTHYNRNNIMTLVETVRAVGTAWDARLMSLQAASTQLQQQGSNTIIYTLDTDFEGHMQQSCRQKASAVHCPPVVHAVAAHVLLGPHALSHVRGPAALLPSWHSIMLYDSPIAMLRQFVLHVHRLGQSASLQRVSVVIDVTFNRPQQTLAWGLPRQVHHMCNSSFYVT